MTVLLICGGLWGLAAALCVLLPRLSRARRVVDAGDAGLELLRPAHDRIDWAGRYAGIADQLADVDTTGDRIRDLYLTPDREVTP